MLATRSVKGKKKKQEMFRSRAGLSPKIKATLKMGQTRLQIHNSKRAQEDTGLKRQIAELLQRGKVEAARVKAERVVQNQMLQDAYETLDMYCDLVSTRAAMFDASDQRELPRELWQSVGTLVWAAQRTDVEELQQFRDMMLRKYGMQLVEACDSQFVGMTNPIVTDKMSMTIPDLTFIVQCLSEIADQHKIPFDSDDLMESLTAPVRADQDPRIVSMTRPSALVPAQYQVPVSPNPGVVSSAASSTASDSSSSADSTEPHGLPPVPADGIYISGAPHQPPAAQRNPYGELRPPGSYMQSAESFRPSQPNAPRTEQPLGQSREKSSSGDAEYDELEERFAALRGKSSNK